MEDQTFGVILKTERELRNWTRDCLAQQIGSTSKTIARWERGETLPRVHFQQKLCVIFDKSPQDLGLETKIVDEKKLSGDNLQDSSSHAVKPTNESGKTFRVLMIIGMGASFPNHATVVRNIEFPLSPSKNAMEPEVKVFSVNRC